MKKTLKVLGLILIGFVLGIMVAPSGDTSTETVNEVVENEEEVATADAQTEEQPEEAAPAEKAPTPVFEDDSVKVSFAGVDGTDAKLLVENKTAIAMTVQDDSFSINGFSTSGNTTSDSVAPNSKGFVTIDISELGDVGVPETVSGKLNAFNSESYDPISNVTFANKAVK
ncbi:hypothetical protein [Domibacillus robiginosus]|uniref:hypothetical protein n=1 Tax=Domibacillus robiginosus TaxID=1071054 RepID=UPI00067CBFC7|nr:hypothetical protein [Domibacillus robiginosus]